MWRGASDPRSRPALAAVWARSSLDHQFSSGARGCWVQPTDEVSAEGLGARRWSIPRGSIGRYRDLDKSSGRRLRRLTPRRAAVVGDSFSAGVPGSLVGEDGAPCFFHSAAPPKSEGQVAMAQVPGSQGPFNRADDLRAGVRLSLMTIVWNVIAGGAAVLTAVAIGSLSLAGFGLNAALDSIASAALVWRFATEARNPSRGHHLEGVTVRIVGATLIVVALYVGVQAVRSLRSHSGSDASIVALVIAGLSLLVLPILAFAKLRLAGRLKSRALRGDGVLTAIGATLAAFTILGLVLHDLLGWWWSDAVAALIISGLLVREGVLTLNDALDRP
jgi:hypothetical protein